MRWSRLLRALPSDLRDAVTGDLEEEYAAIRSRRGAAFASAWAWWTAARLAVTFRLERATHVRGVPPIAEELRTRTLMWDTLRQDVVFSLRMLRRQPGFTTVALIALALGIGANTAIFSVVDSVLWRPLPYPDAHRIVSLAEQRPRESRWFGPVSPADFYDWRADARSFAAMAAYIDGAASLTGSGEPERLKELLVTPGFFDAIGVAPSAGRDFRAEEETFGRHRVALLTDGLWRRRFGADTSIVGRTLTLDGYPYEVVGILPARFWWKSGPDIVVPMALTDSDRALRAAHFVDIVARLRAGTTIDQAREELKVIGAHLSQAYPTENRYHAPNIRSLRESLVGDVRESLLVLLGAVGFVMLIACANVATLLLARASGRHKELSVRRAVGATRGRLVRQMLTESLVVAFAGGMAGLILAQWCLTALGTVVPAQFTSLPGMETAGLDGRVLLAAFALSAATGVVFGVVPAVVASDQRLGTTLTEEARGTSGGRRSQRLRAMLVVSELALSLVLLTGAALLIVSFSRLTEVATGFQPDHLVTSRLSLPVTRYADRPRIVAFYEGLFERLRAMPGIQRVAATSAPPFSGLDGRLDLEIEKGAPDIQGPVRAHPRLVSSEYLATMGIPLVRGRMFTDADREESTPVTIINEAAARRFWPTSDPIGQRVSLGSPRRWMEIVGIVGNVHHLGLDTETSPEAFMPQRQGFTSLGATLERSLTVVIRSSSDVRAVAPLLRAAVADIDPQQPLGLIRTMDEMIADSVAPRRLNFVLVSAFALVALVLTAAGLYGVMAYLVVQRTREIGVRMALGASPGQVRAMIMRQAGAMTAVGIGIGIAGALLLTRSMTSLLFGVSPADPVIYVTVALLLAVVASAAVAVPSSRATRVDPLIALRDS